MEGLVKLYPAASGTLKLVLSQAARELLLLESSDWPFLVTTGQAREYAENRFQEHVSRFNRLADMAQNKELGNEAVCYADELFELDKLFPNIDYRVFANREQRG